ncbi:multidrug resistance protein, MATE family [Bacteroides luti]|jgi:putative efflux protein, MATE family|uniref:Multidrug-efflux transporter n=1 Tax=Bacteroides luti TaxID=1297750 RepID=A0A1M5EYB1_9BACE|nr:MATE family efflux transporter [Bacteroides luti]SHF84245.1 multidrug resistance protein, MATE family [Bacteroides luti]
MIGFFATYKEHYNALLRLGIPIVIGQLGMIILGFADTMMVGQHSTIELAAASFVNNVFTLAIIFSTGFSYGLTPIVGSLFGKGDSTGAGQALKNSLAANILVALLITFIMFVIYLNVHNFGQPKELLPLIRPYFLILLASLIFVLIFNSFKQFADGITDTKASMWILLIGNTLHIILNYLLIYGKLGLPEMGLMGAGLSTLISRILMALAFAGIFLYSKRYAIYLKGFKLKGFSHSIFKRLNELGWPIALQMGMETASFTFSTVMVGWLGSIALASHQVMLTISSLCFMIYYGMGAAIAVRVSNFRGQNDIVNVRRSAYAGFHIIAMMAVISAGSIFLLRNYLGGMFTDSPEVSQTVVALIFPFLLYQFGDGTQITFANALRGIADVKPMMYIAFISYFLISIPAGYFFGFILNWGIVGIWMSFPFGLSSAGIMFYLRFRKRTLL